jgi:S-adenosylmethionine decarboxylase proenzyme
MTFTKPPSECVSTKLSKNTAEKSQAPEGLDDSNSAELAGYPFLGTHFLASYTNCNRDRLLDHEGLINALSRAIEGAGATILKTCEQPFPNGGFTAVILLAESHASLHTYPEHSSCFVDFFTCGRGCDHSAFTAILERYMQPEQTIQKIIVRSN